MAKLSRSNSIHKFSLHWVTGIRLNVLLFTLLVLISGAWSQTTSPPSRRNETSDSSSTTRATTMKATTETPTDSVSDVVPTDTPSVRSTKDIFETTTKNLEDPILDTSSEHEPETTTATITLASNDTTISSNDSAIENEWQRIHRSIRRVWEMPIPHTEIRIGYLLSGAIGAIVMLILVSFWCCCCQRCCRRRRRCTNCKNGHGGSEASDFLYMDNDPRSKYSF